VGESAAERISEIAAQGLTTMKARAAESTAAAKAAADEATARAQAEAQKVKDAAEKAGAVVESKAKAAAAKAAPTDANVQQWGRWMADQLRRSPEIKAYGAIKLRELGEKGPPAVRGLWATAKDAMESHYADTTVEDLLNQFPLLTH
jgi:hypothetical protein